MESKREAAEARMEDEARRRAAVVEAEADEKVARAARAVQDAVDARDRRKLGLGLGLGLRLGLEARRLAPCHGPSPHLYPNP